MGKGRSRECRQSLSFLHLWKLVLEEEIPYELRVPEPEGVYRSPGTGGVDVVHGSPQVLEDFTRSTYGDVAKVGVGGVPGSGTRGNDRTGDGCQAWTP